MPELRTDRLLAEVSVTTEDEYDREWEEWWRKAQEETELEVQEEISRATMGCEPVLGDPPVDDPIEVSAPIAQAVAQEPIVSIPAHYAHFGKRRRRFTEEMVRCPLAGCTLEAHSEEGLNLIQTGVQCNALLWTVRIDELRNHLAEHVGKREVDSLSDEEVTSRFIEAKRAWIPLGDDDEDPFEEG